MADPVEKLEDVLMLVVLVAVIAGLFLGAEQVYAFFHKEKPAPKDPPTPQNNPQPPHWWDPTWTASNVFLWKPASADSSNSWWQWLSYLFNVPEGSPTLDSPAVTWSASDIAGQMPISLLTEPINGSWETGGNIWNTGHL